MLAGASAVAATLALALAAPGAAPAQEASQHPVRAFLVELPAGVEPDELSAIDGAALGLLSGSIGDSPSAQAYLDVTQGARLNPSLYDGDVPLLELEPEGRIMGWRAAVDRAAAAPADLVPGLLADSLRSAGVPVRAERVAGRAAAMAADRAGRVELVERCDGCPGLTVLRGSVARARALAATLRRGDLLIAFARPPAPRGEALAIAAVGLGDGVLTSDSTRLDGLVLSTDVAPTILELFEVAAPAEVDGTPIRAEGEADAGAVADLSERLGEIGPRRAPVIGTTLLVWAALTALAGVLARRRALEVALRLLTVAVAYLPAVLLLGAALEPSQGVEHLLVAVGAPALAAATLRAAPGWGALAIAGGASVLAYAVDVVVGSPLTSMALIGPNPVLGVRFYGIGNELEATLAALVPIATGAALAASMHRPSRRRAAAAFALSALVAVVAFAPGRFGADVGAAIGIPAGAAVAVAALLGGGWRRGLAIAAAPFAALALLAGLDLALGGDAHLSRSVLEAGGLDEVGQVAERRLRLCAASFARYADTPAFVATIVVIVAGIAWRRRVVGWFEGCRPALAGLLGAAAATAVGTLANDSGALLLMIGTALTSLCAGYAWTLSARR